jgi:ABC-type sugar transport system ATPase subunit
MPSNETILDLENIDKRFGGVHALNNVSFFSFGGGGSCHSWRKWRW